VAVLSFNKQMAASFLHIFVDDIFIKGISASEAGHLHNFGNRVALRACFGMVRHEGASLLAVVYSITGIDVIKAPPDLRPKGLGGQ
jgi:hypothetical protein